jgi:hypothetical protein
MRADVGAALRKWKWDFSLQENLARLRAIAGADDAALLEDIDHAGGAGVAEAEAALEKGGAAFLLLAGDLDALDDEFLVGDESALGALMFGGTEREVEHDKKRGLVNY